MSKRGRFLTFFALIFVGLAGGWFGYTHLPRPVEADTELFEGVRFVRKTLVRPRTVVLNVVIVDLDAPGVRLDITAPEPDNTFRAMTTSEFLKSKQAQLAINASFFWPFHSVCLLDYYPHVGDAVLPCGLYVRHGNLVVKSHRGFPSLYLGRGSRASLDPPIGKPYDAISGNFVLLRQGVVQSESAVSSDQRALQPRTAIGLSPDGRLMYLLVVDGRQPNCSEGLGLEETACILKDFGAADALNLDGGGSEAMAAEGPDGQPTLLSRPIDAYIPGRERAVATHLAVFANRLNHAERRPVFGVR